MSRKMQFGNFAHSVVVRECPSRHCFISLPRPWASLTIPAQTPTFNLEVSDEKSLLLSWAGDMHNPNPGEENSVLVSREVLRNNGISDGESGMITQVEVPPPCSSVVVHVKSLTEWQDLALNAEVAQSAFLNQVRVLSLGQSLPLWLEGGVRINLTVARIDPPHSFGVLQPFSHVEVLPPSDQEESEGFGPISFTPAETDSEKEKLGKESSENEITPPDISADTADLTNVSNDVNVHPSFQLMMKYLSFRLEQLRPTSDFTLKKNFCLGYRVLPMPKIVKGSHFSDTLTRHPSLVIVSRQSLLGVHYQNEISFIAKLKKIDSPKERAEKLALIREDDKTKEVKHHATVSEGFENSKSSEKLCTVLVWDNFLKKGDVEFMNDISVLVNENSCIISDCLRRLMKLETFSIVELSTNDMNMKTLPLTVDMSPLVPIDSEGIGVVCDSLKQMLSYFVDDFHLVIDTATLFNVRVKDKDIDVFVSVRDGVPLKLNRESIVLLDMTHVTDPLNVPHICSNVSGLDVKFSAKFQYLGSEKVMLDLKQHILLGSGYLVQQYRSVPQFALLHGSRGSGKSSLLETLAQNLSGFPYFFFFQFVNFKQLKGKKMETVEKKLQTVFREAIFHRPSVIVLEDLDCLVPSRGIDDQDSGPLHDYTMQMVNMLKGLLDDLLEFCHTGDDFLHHRSTERGSVTLVASALLRTSVHPLLVNPQGCHYFPCSFGIPPLEPKDRVRALNTMIENYLQDEKCNFSSVSHGRRMHNLENEGPVENYERKYSDIHCNLAMKLTENYVLPDLNHLALRTFLQAQHRWQTDAKNFSSCSRCGKAIVKKRQSTSNSLLDMVTCENESGHISDPSITSVDLKAAQEGYIPLALRGLDVTQKKASTTTLKVGGLAEARKALKETLTWPSTYPNLFSKIQLRLRSGVLLYGPPGCGKTLLANSVAESCQLNFISVKGPELLSKYIGASEQAVREAFERASSAKPCILFFDEFESIAPRRGHDSTGVTDRVVNQLLTQMDGVEGLTGVYVLAATSRPDLIDPALLRPGRLDKCVFCPMPTITDRADILQILSEDVHLGEEIDWGEFANVTENYSGADLQSILSTSQILVAQEALGDSLYEGVIAKDQMKTLESTKLSHGVQEIPSLNSPEKKKDDDTVLVQIALEKEKNKVVIKEQNGEEDNAYKKQNGNSNLEENHLDNNDNLSALGRDEVSAEKEAFKVYKRHIKAALAEIKPSVTAIERQKYELLYSSFNKSRDGNFGKQTPGKRATLA